jgi:hypothetical protein
MWALSCNSHPASMTRWFLLGPHTGSSAPPVYNLESLYQVAHQEASKQEATSVGELSSRRYQLGFHHDADAHKILLVLLLPLLKALHNVVTSSRWKTRRECPQSSTFW